MVLDLESVRLFVLAAEFGNLTRPYRNVLAKSADLKSMLFQ